MSTSAKSSLRKDKLSGIGNIFVEQDQKKAELQRQSEQSEPEAAIIQDKKPEKEEKVPEKPAATTEKGRGVKKTDASAKQKDPGVLFFKEKKQRYQTKSVYLSTSNIEFIKQQSESNGLAFSEVLNQIIEHFRGNI